MTCVTVAFVVFVTHATPAGPRLGDNDGVRRPRPLADLSVARQILLLQVGVVVALVAAAIALTAYDARRDVRDHATDRAVAVAEAVADSPTVRAAVTARIRRDRAAILQPYAEQVRVDTDTDFVVVMGLDRIRYTHPNPDNIGKPFIGDLGDAPEGEVFTEEATGTLGPSVRAVVPVRDGDRGHRAGVGRDHGERHRPRPPPRRAR